MFPTVKAAKSTALAALKNHWPLAIAAATIPLIFFVIITNLLSVFGHVLSTSPFLAAVYSVFILLFVAVGFPLLLGTLRVLWSIETEQPLGIIEIFYYFSSLKEYKRAVTFIVLQLGSLVIKSVLLLLPSFIIDYISNSPSFLFGDVAMPLWVDSLWIFALFLRIIAVVCIAYIALRYYLSPFLFVTLKDTDSFEIIATAKKVSRVSFGAFITLLLSLIGWIVLSLFFAPLVFTAPYITMCYLVHSRFAVVFYNSRKKKYDRGVGL